MPHATDPSEPADRTTPVPAPPPAAADATGAGRPLTAGLALLAVAVAVVNLLVGTALTGVALTGHAFGAWPSPRSLSQGLIGAAMLGTAPALFAVGRARTWQDTCTLLVPTAVVLLGLFTVSVLNAGRLYVAVGGPVLSVFFSIGWLLVLGVLCAWTVTALSWQRLTPAGPAAGRGLPLPAWSKPALAVLGSSWFGIGTGLLLRPAFWSAFVPWRTGRLDAQALGVWALALGVGVLAALAEDDLHRTRPALLALTGTAAAMAVVLAARGADVDWTSGPGAGLAVMTAGLLTAGTSGRLLLAAQTRGTSAAPPAAPGPLPR
ncbi:hypothetical protein [Streptomyces sp. NPDC051014]|uniref:hypothetical protein n=1 Tax=Streptomyces sp. NPDC051014 TaxID=3155751 RepID=UPI0033DFEF64